MSHTIPKSLRVLCVILILLLTLTACATDLPAETTDPPSVDTTEDTTEGTTTAEATSGETVGGDSDSPPVDDSEPSDHITADSAQNGKLTELLTIEAHTDASGNNCRIVQGACTDGTYYYVALNDGKSSSLSSVSAIRKYDLRTGELVKTYEGLTVSHANDMTVNPDTNELFIAHNSPDFTTISVFDLETLTLKEKKTIALKIYAIAYDPFEECYWIGISGSYDFAKLDLSFKQIGSTYIGKNTGYTKQGIDVDSKYLYFAQFNTNCIIVYDKAGSFVKQINLSVGSSSEAENVCHVGDTLYIGYYTSSSGGGKLYKTEITEALAPAGSASMTKWLTVDQYTDREGNLCKVAQGACTDGTYLYLMMNNDKKADYRSTLLKIELATGKIVATAEGFKSGSTNDITYNPKTKQILAIHGTPAANKVIVIDAETMTHVETKTLDLEIYCITYDEALDCYWAGLLSGYDFVRLDPDLRKVGETYTGYVSGYTRQSVNCDGRYVYFILSAPNSVAVYDKADGAFLGLVTLPVTANSAQSICNVGDAFYIGYNVGSSGGFVYKVSFRIGD